MKRTVSIILCISILLLSVFTFASCNKKVKVKDGPVAYVLAEKGNTYSLGLGEKFKEVFEQKGANVVMETFPAGTQSFSEFYSRAIDESADVIFLPNSIANAPALLKNAKEMGITVPILAGDTWESPVVLESVADTGLELYITTFFDESDTTPKAKEFVKGFKLYVADYYEMNGNTDMVSAVSALGYDAYNVTLDAIEYAGKQKGEDLTSVDIAKALWNTDHEGTTGKIEFDKNGDAIKDRAYIKKASADGSGFEFVKVQTVDNNAEKSEAPKYENGGVSVDKDNKRINIGVYQPTTGDDSAGGNQELLGIMYAHHTRKTVKLGGAEYEVNLIVSDNGSKQENALAAAKKLLDDGAVAVIGSYGSGVSMAAAPVFEEGRIPAIGASCTNEMITYGNDYYFRTTILDVFQCVVMADFAFGLIDNK